jgi:hypothetical protein
MDHSVLATLKIKYQYSLLHSHTEVIEEGRGMLENLKKKPTRSLLDSPGRGEYLAKSACKIIMKVAWRGIKSN